MADLEERGLVLDSIFYEVPALRILQGVYLRVEPGEVCSLFGRNGSGKSTLLKVGAGQVNPSSGLVIIDGVRFHKKSLRRRFSKIAYLPQDSMLPGDLKVGRLMAAFPNAAHLTEDDIVERLLSRRVRELSGGERRYLEIQLLLHLERAYVLMDEPFTGVEPHLVDSISQLLTEAARQGVGFLITDHYHHYTLPITDNAYVMTNKQCQHLEQNRDLREQLEAHGYLSVR